MTPDNYGYGDGYGDGGGYGYGSFFGYCVTKEIEDWMNNWKIAGEI